MGFNCGGGVEKTLANRQQEVWRLVAGSSPAPGADKIIYLAVNALSAFLMGHYWGSTGAPARGFTFVKPL